MKKNVVKLSLGFLVTIALAIGANEIQSKKQLGVSDLTLANIEALASGEDTKACPGGYCSYRTTSGSVCEACCPDGKTPKCDAFGCTCVRDF